MINASVEEMLRLATDAYHSGHTGETQAICQKILDQDAGNFDALRLLGCSQVQSQQIKSGIEFLTRALEITPSHAETLYELGRALYMAGQVASALGCFEKAEMANPEYAEASNAKGIMQSALGKSKEAMVSFQRAVAINPDYAGAHNNLGNERLLAREYKDSLSDFDSAIRLQPDFANAYNGRGNALLCLGRHANALSDFDKAVALNSQHVEAWTGRGNALTELHRYEEAIASYEQALGVELAGKGLRGQIATGNNRYRPLFENYRHLLEQSTGATQIICSIGKLLRLVGKQRESIELLDLVLSVRPDDKIACEGKAKSLRDLGYFDGALEFYELNFARHPDSPELLSAYLFNLNYVPGLSQTDVFAQHKKFGELFEKPLKPTWRAHENVADPDKTLRIGFVSADLRNHPVGYFLENVLAQLCTNSLNLYAYDNNGESDEVTERLRSAFHVWRDISQLKDEDVAGLVRADGIDVLVDLSGHTKGNRLLVFARKPAPVQVTYLGYFATTGLTGMDYFLGDRWQMPEGESIDYTETPFRLPGHHLCLTPPKFDIPVSPLPALQNGYVTFGNFNNADKMNEAVIECWANILESLPGSRLFLKAEHFASADVVARTLERFAVHGIDRDRLILEGNAPFEDYLKSYQRVDLALDPFPYNGGTVTMQALWMGVPVLTMYGYRHVARHGAGVMHTMGMPEWVAKNREDYVRRAVAHASDTRALSEVRENLRERFLTSSLCDAPSFARNLEEAFRTMWREWCANPVFGFARHASGDKK